MNKLGEIGTQAGAIRALRRGRQSKVKGSWIGLEYGRPGVGRKVVRLVIHHEPGRLAKLGQAARDGGYAADHDALAGSFAGLPLPACGCDVVGASLSGKRGRKLVQQFAAVRQEPRRVSTVDRRVHDMRGYDRFAGTRG